MNAARNVGIAYENWYNVAESFGGADIRDVEQIKNKMDESREIYGLIAGYTDVLKQKLIHMKEFAKYSMNRMHSSGARRFRI